VPAPSPIDCLIVGAGPIGLTLAVELQRFGLACRIIDQSPVPTDKSKALVVWPRTLELLDRAAIANDFIAAGMWAKGARMFDGTREIAHVQVQTTDSAFPGPLMIPQNETERLLTETLQRRGLRVERSVTLLQCVDNGDSVTSTLRHPDGREETVTSAWLGGCDGSHSTVRKQLGIEFTGSFEPNDWILADAYADGPISRDEISAFWHSDGVAIFFPIGHGRFRVIADMGLALNTEKPADPTLAQVQTLVDRRAPVGVRLRDPFWLSGFRIHERKVNEYGRNRVFLCGDAAHIHSPAGGQGMNTGMQDAFNLAWKIALVHRGLAPRSPLLDSYSQERGAVGDMVLHNAGLFTRVAMIRNPALQFLRNHLIAFATKFTAVQQRAIATLTELAVHYPDSPLNAEDPGSAWHGDVKSGDRLPDAELLDLRAGKIELAPASSPSVAPRSGAKEGPAFACTHIGNIARIPSTIRDQLNTRLLTAVGGSKHTLLLFPTDASSLASLLAATQPVASAFSQTVQLLAILPKDSAAQPPANLPAFLDLQNHIRDRLGLRATALALVRPDGYLAFRGHANSAPKLRQHLQSYLLPN
jgi:2-polyprenyl-6-methoxyphenol hydroxylase-like FAD-dependent oxidoreductase